MLDAQILSEAGEQLRESRVRIAELEEELLSTLKELKRQYVFSTSPPLDEHNALLEERIAELEKK